MNVSLGQATFDSAPEALQASSIHIGCAAPPRAVPAQPATRQIGSFERRRAALLSGIDDLPQPAADAVLRGIGSMFRCTRVSIIATDRRGSRQRALLRVPAESEIGLTPRTAPDRLLRMEEGDVHHPGPGHICASLWRHPSIHYVLELFRGQPLRSFEAEEIGRFLGALPGLRLALRAIMDCPSTGLASEVFNRLSQGVALIGPDHSLISANPAMQAFLLRGDGLVLERGALRARNDADQTRLVRAIRLIRKGHIQRSELLSLSRQSLRPNYLALVERFSAYAPAPGVEPEAVKFTVVDPDHSDPAGTTRTAAAYGLTPTETAVVAAMLRGLNAAGCAKELGLSTHTVRWHFKRIFAKTGASGRPELLMLLMRSAQLLGG